MKKIIYFCGMMLLSLNMMAQIDTLDQNWECVLNDDFTDNGWDTWYNWSIIHPFGHYKAFIPEWPSGVSRGPNEHHVYQRENCQFSNNGILRFISVYEGGPNAQPLQCGNYCIPPGKTCDTEHQTLFYTSGKIETDVKYLYGYFEIKCSLPIHKGSFPAFWLYGGSDNYYNEIDIFEYSWGIPNTNHKYNQFTCGIYCDNYHNVIVSYAREEPFLPGASADLRQPHVFACEWMPDRVTWYVDGTIVNECTEYEKIPHHAMALKVNYAIDNYAVPSNGPQMNQPIWFDGDEMTVDYIKVYQLKTNCDTDILISNALGYANYQPSVKKSIRIEPLSEFTAPTNTNVTMRAVDSIVIKQGFSIAQGAQMTLLTQPCPE